MVPLTFAEVASVVEGELRDAPDPLASVTAPAAVDSREASAGGLFVCIVGDWVDGHDFVGPAFDNGAVLALASHPVGVPAVVVDDVVAALGRLAHHCLTLLPDLRVVAVTGSSGKTSTKDLLARVAALAGPTVAPAGNLNNEIGVPLTVLRTEASTRVLVLELGARGVGHIAELCAIAAPDIGVVLNVGTAHVGEFGSVDAVALAKGELVESLTNEGMAVLNADDAAVAAMAARTAAQVMTFGRADTADVRAEEVLIGPGGRPAFTLVTPEGRARVVLRLVGRHHVSNALAAAAAGRALGLGVDQVAEVLSTAAPASRWRMEVTERADGVTVVNDAYNANPESMRAAVDALIDLATGRRTWAVLGAMLELGDNHDAAHDAVGRQVAELGVDRLVVVGEAARPMLRAARLGGSGGEGSVLVADVEAATELLRREIRPGDVVLVKASRSMGLERVAAALLDEPTGGGEA